MSSVLLALVSAESWHLERDGGACSVTSGDVQGPAREACSFLHGPKPQRIAAPFRGGRNPFPVVVDSQYKGAILLVHGNLHFGRLGVTPYVGQRLLHSAEHCG